jgi:hypothetical protein
MWLPASSAVAASVFWIRTVAPPAVTRRRGVRPQCAHLEGGLAACQTVPQARPVPLWDTAHWSTPEVTAPHAQIGAAGRPSVTCHLQAAP